MLGKLVHKLPSFLAVGLLGSLGVGVGYGVTMLLNDAAATSTVTSVETRGARPPNALRSRSAWPSPACCCR
ncbi:MAG: hypothetical protein H6723_15880 [Sandaracinus sp.]|nr:hypothetical protein [Sandaracinus sp.]